MGPINKSPHKNQTNRSTHESYDVHEQVKGKSWVRLDDGSIAPMPKIHPMGQETSDEQALDEAIIGLK